MHRFIDLFCGIGGFRVALQQEGMECVFSCDIDSNVCRVYEQNFGDYPHGDIVQIDAKEIPPHDILCAGFPCQPFSLAGKAGAFSDSRGRLFFEIIRIAKYHRPYMLLLENVKNILTVDSGDVLSEIAHSIEEIGYTLKHYVLNSSHFGVPQRRERVYFVALRNDSQLKHSNPQPTYKRQYLRDILMDNDLCEPLIIKRNDIFIKDEPNNLALAPIQIGYVNKGGQGERIYSVKGHAVTQSASSGGVGKRCGLYKVNGEIRRLHIKEAKRVMGFNTEHHVSGGLLGYSQLGNSVIPSMINTIYQSVKVQ